MFNNAEYIYEVYKERSFSRAARNLYISQPSLSATVRRVEDKIGAPIFDRSVTPLGLTECGEKYIEAVQQVLDLKQGFLNYLDNLRELKTGSISIGGSNLFTSYILPPIVAAFKQRYPQVAVHVLEANTPLLEQDLIEGGLDLIIDNYSFDPATHASRLFRREHLLLAVPKHFAVNAELADFQISREDIVSGAFLGSSVPPAPFPLLAQLPMILLRSGNDTREKALRLFQKYNCRPNVVLDLDQLMTAYNVTSTGIGCSLVTDTLVLTATPHPDVVFYKIDPDCSERRLCFFYKKGKYMTRPMEEFLRIADASPLRNGAET